MSTKNNRIKLVLLATALVAACSTTAFAANWEPVVPVNTTRDQFAAGVIDNKIYIFGGNDINPEVQNDLQSTEMLDLD